MGGQSLSAADGWLRPWGAVGAVTSGVPAAEDEAPHPSTLSPALGAFLGFRAGGLSGLPLGLRPLRNLPLCLSCCGLLPCGARGGLRLSTARFAACSAASWAGVFTIQAGSS